MAAIVTYQSLLSVTFALTVFIISFSNFSPIEANNGGFSVDLIHRDSPKSPFYNSSQTPSERLHNALRRSINRANNFMPTSISPNTPQSSVITNNGEYLMNISLGTPKFSVLAIADTGSDIIWTQCKPCSDCYKQKDPLFDPKKSSTYKEIPCPSTRCESLRDTSCLSKVCHYSVSYGDQSFTHGVLALETLTLGSTSNRPVPFRNTIFGCGHNNDGTFDENGSGIVGLGGGPGSLITQMGSSIGGKFSYCLVPIFSESVKSSKMNFGSNGVISGSGVLTTPLVSRSPETFYYLTLEGISVGEERVNFYNPSSLNASKVTEGNIIIDSGTTLTLLPEEWYDPLELAVRKAIDLEPVKSQDPSLSLCYKSKTDFDVPIIMAHFTNADLKLNPLNTFVRTSSTIVCFAFVPYQDLAIFGNLAQMNFLVAYDLEEMTLSFKPTDCTKE